MVGALAAPLLFLPCAAWAADPEEKAPPAAWPTSPFLGAVDGVTGVPIPWLCRSGGSVYRLGDTVCMSTHLGVQMARCDLVLNNTSWVPIGVPCAMGSGRRSRTSRILTQLCWYTWELVRRDLRAQRTSRNNHSQ